MTERQPYQYLDSRSMLFVAIMAAQTEAERVRDLIRHHEYEAGQARLILEQREKALADLRVHAEAANRYVHDQYEAQQATDVRAEET